MFTGLIREFAEVVSYSNNILTLKAAYKPKIGDSIAVNGACLTVTHLSSSGFSVELSLETRELLALENLNGKVHIEPALALGDRLDGHIVQGHVDCVGVIQSFNQRENGLDIEVGIPEKFITFVIPKGSITIDGVSLTVNDVSKKSFRLTIIPHTLEKTLIGEYKIGRRVNVETDMFARYLYHMFHKKDALDWNGVDRIMALY
ncbi:riboflavin synthase [Sulfurospirillum oryzae]|uniref:riboflavin synthase n=1 Tax=Sulfurospirillum oryzae TaxID=2976535 RepID=UPI0021E92C72|nr:riboflavin synthase [Sulfurospirillum oryzae]